jgi:short-subunit dehydrogenase
MNEHAIFKNKYGPWALIAGASHGVGAALAEELAARGLDCILVARRGDALQALRSKLIERHGVEVLVISQDLSQPGAAARLVEAVDGREVGLLIYNAGGDHFITRFLATSTEDWSKLLRMNTTTVMECCHAFGGAMVERGRGGVILVGSQAATGGVRKLAMYSATKAFVMNLGESLWAEWRDKGVDVLNLLITRVDTPTIRDAMVKLNIPDALDMPLPSAEELARLALRELSNGPTLAHPADFQSGEAGPSASRRRHVIEQSAEAARFIGVE